MANLLTPGNRLYLYDLFVQKIGVGKQVPIEQADEVLASDDILPQDVGYTCAQEILESPYFEGLARIDVFKKGRVLLTILPSAQMDQALAQASKAEEEKAQRALETRQQATAKGTAKAKGGAKQKGSKAKGAAAKAPAQKAKVIPVKPGKERRKEEALAAKIAAEEAARLEAQQKAEELARQEAERKEAERLAQEKAEREAAEAAERAKREAEELARKQAEEREAAKKAAEEAAKRALEEQIARVTTPISSRKTPQLNITFDPYAGLSDIATPAVKKPRKKAPDQKSARDGLTAQGQQKEKAEARPRTASKEAVPSGFAASVEPVPNKPFKSMATPAAQQVRESVSAVPEKSPLGGPAVQQAEAGLSSHVVTGLEVPVESVVTRHAEPVVAEPAYAETAPAAYEQAGAQATLTQSEKAGAQTGQAEFEPAGDQTTPVQSGQTGAQVGLAEFEQADDQVMAAEFEPAGVQAAPAESGLLATESSNAAISAETQGKPASYNGAVFSAAEAERGTALGAALRADDRVFAPKTERQAPPSTVLADYPRTISRDVFCSTALLSTLSRILPLQVDLMALLDEDWDVARATGTVSGSRNRATFPLRYLREDGTQPVEISLKRAAKQGSSVRWEMALVDGDDGRGDIHQTASLEGLPLADEGAWSDLRVGFLHGMQVTGPIREFAQFAVIGTWDAILGDLARTAAPEHWNYPGTQLIPSAAGNTRYGILREYLAVTFHRVRAQGKLVEAPSKTFAAFNTGLVTAMLDEIHACFEPANTGGIPWKFVGFTQAGSGELGGRMTSELESLPQRADYLESLDDLVPHANTRIVLDYHAILGDCLGRLPRGFLRDALADMEGPSIMIDRMGDAALTPTERSAAQTQLSRFLANTPAAHRRISRTIEDAAEQALAACRRSYRTAVPVFDPSNDSIKLLLPLCLVQDRRVDVALVIQIQPSGIWQGTSIMSLPRAYACARVVSAEQPSWLAPQDVLA